MLPDVSDAERRDHDEAWQLDFGDFNEIEVVYEQIDKPENLIKHPMSKNMQESFVTFLNDYPTELTNIDEDGFTLLHRETIAGNLSSVQVLLQSGTDKNLKTNKGKTALDYAKQLNWEHLIPVLEN